MIEVEVGGEDWYLDDPATLALLDEQTRSYAAFREGLRAHIRANADALLAVADMPEMVASLVRGNVDRIFSAGPVVGMTRYVKDRLYEDIEAAAYRREFAEIDVDDYRRASLCDVLTVPPVSEVVATLLEQIDRDTDAAMKAREPFRSEGLI